jgi:hypothetical protein
MKSRPSKLLIHVNRQNIRSNKADGTNLPVISVKRNGRNVLTCNELELTGPSRIVYSGVGCDVDQILKCGARVVIETFHPVKKIN